MGKRFVGAFLLGGLVAFAWMLISWMVLPWHCVTIGEFENESAVANVMLENTRESGVYVLPHLCDSKADAEANAEEMEKGPIIFASIQREGYRYASMYPFVIGLVVQWAGAFFIILLLMRAKIPTYWGKVWFTTLFGLAIGILGYLPAWNWWGFSFGYTVVGILDLVIAWWLAGLVIAPLAHPKKK